MARSITNTPPTSVPARQVHQVMGAAGNPAPSGPRGLNPLVREVRGLLRWALDRRQQAIQYQWSRLPHQTMTAQVNKLETWYRFNPTPSPKTLVEWWAENHTTVRYVMPGNDAGRARLEQLENLMTKLGRV